MSSLDRKLANAVGGISARPCDNCVRKRARWYCAAHDVFLCQSCDSAVHWANPRARRHERVGLKTGAMIRSVSDDIEAGPGFKISVPSWNQGVTRKARSPRQKKHTIPRYDDDPLSGISGNPPHMVPEICSEECTGRENDEQLLHMVPVFHPLVSDLWASETTKGNTQIGEEIERKFGHVPRLVSDEFSQELDLDNLAADLESLFGKGMGDEWFDMEGLWISECCDVKERESSWKPSSFQIEGAVKIEEANHITEDELIRIGRKETSLELNLSDSNAEDDTKALVMEPKLFNKYEDSDIHVSRKIFLRLDYNGVMSAWDSQKSPWTTGGRPDLDSFRECCWPFCLGMCGTIHNIDGDTAGGGGREARVMRYREKRRTRLFSKKIRYQVRKLNAEKRPRIKGRFVKKTKFCAE